MSGLPNENFVAVKDHYNDTLGLVIDAHIIIPLYSQADEDFANDVFTNISSSIWDPFYFPPYWDTDHSPYYPEFAPDSAIFPGVAPSSALDPAAVPMPPNTYGPTYWFTYPGAPTLAPTPAPSPGATPAPAPTIVDVLDMELYVNSSSASLPPIGDAILNIISGFTGEPPVPPARLQPADSAA